MARRPPTPLQKAQGVVSELAQGRTGGRAPGNLAVPAGLCRPGWRKKGLGRRTTSATVEGRRAAWGRPARRHTDGQPRSGWRGSGVSASHGSGATGAAGVADPGGSGAAGVGSAATMELGPGSANAIGGAGDWQGHRQICSWGRRGGMASSRQQCGTRRCRRFC